MVVYEVFWERWVGIGLYEVCINWWNWLGLFVGFFEFFIMFVLVGLFFFERFGVFLEVLLEYIKIIEGEVESL